MGSVIASVQATSLDLLLSGVVGPALPRSQAREFKPLSSVRRPSPLSFLECCCWRVGREHAPAPVLSKCCGPAADVGRLVG